MKLKRQSGLVPGLAVALALTACGGSSGGSPSTDGTGGNPPGATSVSVTAIGTITGFGSVFVNGMKYEVNANTVVSIEDEAEATGDDGALRMGMKVRVSAVDDSGVRTARSIEYDDDLEGPVEAITPDSSDPSIGSFLVMGQTVTVDPMTIFDDDIGNNDGTPGIDLRDLAIGMVVEVSGYPNGDGFLATRVDRELGEDGSDPTRGDPLVDDDELEIKGFVDAVADDLSSVTVGGVVFLIDENTMLEDGIVIDAALVGAFVEVEADIVGEDYVAVKIEREDGLDDDDRDGEFEIEGILQSVDTTTSPNTFTVNGIAVEVSDASSLEPLVGHFVEIEGRFDANGVLVISEAERDEEDNVGIEDLVTVTNTDAQNFTTRLGLVIGPTGGSSVDDDADDSDGDHLTPAQFVRRLQPGDRIEARGFDDGTGVDWIRVEREEVASENDDFECELRGPVQSVSGDADAFSFVIQGVTVETGRVQDEDFRDADEFPIGRAEFFARLEVGSLVEAESFDGDSFCMDGMLDARQVEFDD